MNYLDFNSRETYLVKRAQWKIDFVQAILAVRKCKIAIKQCQRAMSVQHAISKLKVAYRQRAGAARAVENLHAIKHKMKNESQRQYVARR